MMPIRLLPIMLLAVSSPAFAQGAQAPDPAAAQVAAVQQQLLAAQQEIVRLRAEIANQHDQAALMIQCREKNGRLVAIGNELIAAYEKHFRRSTDYLPFQFGRRKFEAETQVIGDRVYDNRLDAAPRRAEPAPAATPPQ